MAQSRKRRHDAKKLTALQEHVKLANQRIIEEHRIAGLLVEVMDEEDLNKVSQIIDKLRSIANPQLPVLSKAIDIAITELNKYTAGGPITKAWSKLKSKVGIDNPVVKITTFADALERGFSQMPVIIKNNVGNLKNIDTSKSLSTLLAEPKKTGTEKTIKTDKESTFADDPVGSHWPGPSQNEADGTAPSGKLKTVADQMLKALAPGGIFGAFKRIPYIDPKALVQELITAPINAVAPAVKKMQGGVHAADVAKDMQSQVTGTGGAETKGSQPGVQSNKSTGSSGGAPTENPDVTTPSSSGSEKPADPRGGSTGQSSAKKLEPKSVEMLAKDFSKKSGVDYQLTLKVLNALNNNEKLREVKDVITGDVTINVLR